MDGFSGGGHYCIDKGMVEWIGRHIMGGGWMAGGMKGQMETRKKG